MTPEHVRRAAILLEERDDLNRLRLMLQKSVISSVQLVSSIDQIPIGTIKVPVQFIERMVTTELMRGYDEMTRLGVTHLGTPHFFNDPSLKRNITEAPPPPDLNERVKQGGPTKEGNSL